MSHRAGGKITGSHTTTADGVGPVVDFLEQLGCVTKIVLGIITNKRGSSSGGNRTRVKIIDQSNCVLVRFSKGGIVQEIWFYCLDGKSKEAKLALAKFAIEKGWTACVT